MTKKTTKPEDLIKEIGMDIGPRSLEPDDLEALLDAVEAGTLPEGIPVKATEVFLAIQAESNMGLAAELARGGLDTSDPMVAKTTKAGLEACRLLVASILNRVKTAQGFDDRWMN